jgi:CRISPR system Cascade subunit CasE
MTVLSRLTPAPRNLTALRDLGDPAEMHRTLMRAFPPVSGVSPRAALGVLFRIEDDDGRARVIVQSEVEPNWDALPDGYLTEVESKSIDEALQGIRDGRVLRFLLVANPTRKIDRPGREQGRRVPLRSDEARHEWLVRRGERHGFELAGSGPHDGVRIDRVLAPRRPRSGSRSRITIDAVRYEGRLVVRDAEQLVDAVRAGIGPAKAYGCGLLSLAPA